MGDVRRSPSAINILSWARLTPDRDSQVLVDGPKADRAVGE